MKRRFSPLQRPQKATSRNSYVWRTLGIGWWPKGLKWFTGPVRRCFGRRIQTYGFTIKSKGRTGAHLRLKLQRMWVP